MLSLYEDEVFTEEDEDFVMTCRRCGRPFMGRDGWRPICHRCFRALRWLHLNQ